MPMEQDEGNRRGGGAILQVLELCGAEWGAEGVGTMCWVERAPIKQDETVEISCLTHDKWLEEISRRSKELREGRYPSSKLRPVKYQSNETMLLRIMRSPSTRSKN